MLILNEQESITATITLEDDDPSTVRRMLTYLYTLDYDDGDAFPAVARDESRDTDGPVPGLTPKPDVNDAKMISHGKSMNNIHVYALVDKYNIPGLIELAKIKFKTCMTRKVKITRFAEIIDSVFSSTPETDPGLRDIIISKAANTSTPTQILREGPLASVIRDHSTFGLGLLRKVVKNHVSEQEKQKQEQKQEFRMKMTELRLSADRLYLKAQSIELPGRWDLQQSFDRCRYAMNAFLEKFQKFQDTLEPED